MIKKACGLLHKKYKYDEFSITMSWIFKPSKWFHGIHRLLIFLPTGFLINKQNQWLYYLKQWWLENIYLVSFGIKEKGIMRQ